MEREGSVKIPEETRAETARDRENRRQNESRIEFYNVLSQMFRTEPFSAEEYKKAKLGNISGGKNRQDRINELIEEGLCGYYSERGIRYYQLKQNRED